MFNSYIAECTFLNAYNAVLFYVGTFDGEDITHIEGDVNPVRDMEIIHNELRLKDLEYVGKRVANLERQQRSGDKALKYELEVLQKVQTLLEEEKKPVRFGHWDQKEIEELNKHLLITSKPMVYLLNLSEKDYIRKKNKW